MFLFHAPLQGPFLIAKCQILQGTQLQYTLIMTAFWYVLLIHVVCNTVLG